MTRNKAAGLTLALSGAGALAAWWWWSAPGGTVSVEEMPSDNIVGDLPYIAPLLNKLEDLGFPMGTPRGIRNNNPGNIEFNAAVAWVGCTGTDGRFCTFDTPKNGIRAIQKILNSYAARGVDTVREVVTSWAPPFENNTASYVAAVASACGVGADQVPNRLSLIKAIIRHENGQQPYTDQQIFAGVAAA